MNESLGPGATLEWWLEALAAPTAAPGGGAAAALGLALAAALVEMVGGLTLRREAGPREIETRHAIHRGAELRQEAVRQLGPMGAREELWQMYQKESSPDVKRQILGALFVSGDSAHLIDAANSEPNVDLRRRAIQHLGTMGRTSTGEALVGLYAKEKDSDIKRSVINALFVQNNADSLVAIARKETDPALKREMVSKLSLMTKSKVAMDYLMELLNK